MGLGGSVALAGHLGGLNGRLMPRAPGGAFPPAHPGAAQGAGRPLDPRWAHRNTEAVMVGKVLVAGVTVVLAVVFAVGYEMVRPKAEDAEELVQRGVQALARHRFEEALALGERARGVAPRRAAVYGVIGDAQVELGRYEEALETVQTMVDLRPDVASYTRVSYLRELQGDVDGAIVAMRRAVDAAPAGAAGAWARVQLGHLLLKKGEVAAAEREYRWAQAADPSSAAAVAGSGRARVAVGDLAGAVSFYERAVEREPLPEFVVALGELYEALGRDEAAARQLELARALQRLAAANGGNVDLELALFEAERGDPRRAVELARAEVARRDSVHAQDALAWALYRAGEYAAAREASRRALRLGTRDGLMLFHAGMIEMGLGEEAEGQRLIREALAADPAFSVRWVRVAREMGG